jgi:excisionase family DNA binding protein
MNNNVRLLLRPSEAAEIIGLSKSKIYQLIATGAVPSLRLEGTRMIRIPLAALERLAEQAVNGLSTEA